MLNELEKFHMTLDQNVNQISNLSDRVSLQNQV